MDKIFEHYNTKQDSILCKVELLQKISRFLPPIDIVNLSHTCKELHQNLPFYLIKSGNFTVVTAPGKKDSSKIWYEGPAINFSVSEINIPITADLKSFKYIWIQIIRSRIAILESQKFDAIRVNNIRLTKKNAVLRGCKPGDKLRFMASVNAAGWTTECSGNFQIFLQLEKYNYGPMYVAKKVEGYEEFNSPNIYIADENDFRCFGCPSLSRLHELDLTGDKFFMLSNS